MPYFQFKNHPSGIVRGTWPQYWNGPGYPPRTYTKSVSVADHTGYTVVGAGVKVANGLVGSSSLAGRTGIFVPTATLTGWLVSGSGQTLLRPLTLSQGLAMSEGLVMSEGLILSEGVVAPE